MMYNEKLAVAIKSAGKVLRENKDTVYLPFGSEYSIFIKNLNSVRALVKVSIDGNYVDENGEGIVIDANSSLDLERFIRNGNLNKGNRFKFIERTGKVEQHRGVQVEDGLIRVEFQYEKRAPKVEEVHHYTHHYWHDYWWDRPYYRSYRCFSSDNSFGAVGGTVCNNGLIGGSGIGAAGGAASSSSFHAGSETPEHVKLNYASVSGNASDQPTFTLTTNDAKMEWAEPNDAGITVAGSESDQQFHTVSGFPLEDASHVIVLKLLGTSSKGVKIVKPVTVKSKQKCTTCGHQNKANAKFCSECGTALELL